MAETDVEKQLRGQNRDLANAIKERDKEIDELRAKLEGYVDIGASDEYELLPVEGVSVVSRYDGLADGVFVFHEAISFRHDNGYSASAIQDRCVDSVRRAVDPARLGLDGSGRCTSLPEFDTSLELEIIVRVLPR